METKQLFPFVLMLVMVGMLIGVGVITMDKFRVASADTFTGNSSISLVNGTAVAIGTSYVKTVASIDNNETRNDGAPISAANYSVSTLGEETVYVTLTEQNVALAYDSTFGVVSDVVFTYEDVSQKAPSIIGSARDELGKVASDWLGLIVTIALLSIILLLVIRSFGQRR